MRRFNNKAGDMVRLHFLLGIMISFLILGDLQAQDETKTPFRVEVANDSIQGDEVCRVRFIIKNMDGEFQPPEFEEFELMGAPHRSSIFRSVNGKTMRMNTYTYHLRPTKTGLLLIPPAQFKSDNATWNTRAVDIWVQPGTLPADPPGKKDKDRETTRI